MASPWLGVDKRAPLQSQRESQRALQIGGKKKKLPPLTLQIYKVGHCLFLCFSPIASHGRCPSLTAALAALASVASLSLPSHLARSSLRMQR